MAKKKGFMDGYKTYDTAHGYGNAQKWRKTFGQRMTQADAAAVLSAQPATPHDILGLAPGASAAEIKKAFRRCMMEWHPDRNQHRAAAATAMTQKIIAAYTQLTA